MSEPKRECLVRPHRSTRCGFCYWALYDGEWCQNKACEWTGKEPPEKVNLSNEEAATLIQAMRPFVEVGGYQHPALKAAWWVNLYANGLITSDLCRSKEQALNKCTYTGEVPDAQQVEVMIVPKSRAERKTSLDWAEAHTYAQQTAKRLGVPADQVDGDSFGVPGIEQLIDMIAFLVPGPKCCGELMAFNSVGGFFCEICEKKIEVKRET